MDKLLKNTSIHRVFHVSSTFIITKHLIQIYLTFHYSGLIGQNWSMIFASVGYQVALYDVVPEQLAGALGLIKETLGRYEKEGHLRGTLTSTEQIQKITGYSSLSECLEGAIYVQVHMGDHVYSISFFQDGSGGICHGDSSERLNLRFTPISQ